MQALSGSLAIVVGQQSYAITFSPAFGVAPTSFLPTIFIPNDTGEIFAVSADLSTLTATGVTVWLNAVPTSASSGGFVNWRASNTPTSYPSPSGQLSGSTALVAGTQYYDLTFATPFGGLPTGVFASVRMPNSSGEVFTASPDYSTLTPRGVRVWLNGTPTSASNGGTLNWLAEGPPPLIQSSVSKTNGRTPLVSGQQDYAIIFPTAFTAPPYSLIPSVMIPGSSGEVFQASVDYDTLTTTGATIRLNGVPTSSSVGGYIDWIASGVIPETQSQGGMRFVQLCNRIGRRARTGDFTRLSLNEQMDLIEAANTGLQRLYNALPVYFKELTQGFLLPGPRTISTVVTQHSKTVSANTFSREEIGRSVQLDGDQNWNQILGPGQLLNPYMGSSGTVAGTVYGNAVYSDVYPLDRIIGNPTFPAQPGFPINRWQLGQMGTNGGVSGLIAQQSIGTPCAWWVQTFGNSQGHSPSVVLRFAPAPSQAYAVDVRMGYWPKRLTLADYQNNTELVVPPQFIESALIPMCIDAFMSSPAYVTKGDEEMLMQRAERGEQFLRQQPGQVGAPNNRIYCPIGF
jgi:hypothetical protein